ncbi:TetR/AcrR family transcriptional regulator [Actinomadura flavalba]|uniref:TetR/AcrR family transcriptional regulator n=1 Tax=Actinomadura flavalba TaxID=1120938 RepID=UPI00037751C0|nr:TetR/AcrR family transcriptional regulator [Actinomadura flavalba]
MESATARRIAQREQTRRLLLDRGRRLFARYGYADVGVGELAATADVTKGAIYHHFTGKAAVFRAILEQVQEEVGARVAAAADARTDPWDRFTAGCHAFLEAGADPAVRRIMLIDGPAVLGWDEWRRMDEAASGRHLVEALEELVAAGTIAPQPVAPLARLISGALNEAALWLAQEGDAADVGATTAALDRLLGGLR